MKLFTHFVHLIVDISSISALFAFGNVFDIIFVRLIFFLLREEIKKKPREKFLKLIFLYSTSAIILP